MPCPKLKIHAVSIKSIKKVQAGYLSVSKLQAGCLSATDHPFSGQLVKKLDCQLPLLASVPSIRSMTFNDYVGSCAVVDSVIYPIYPGLYVWGV